MEFGAVLKELTYKSVCLFFIFISLVKRRPYLDSSCAYMIEKMLPEHYIEVKNTDALNHAYTKGGTVWNLVPFLKN